MIIVLAEDDFVYLLEVQEKRKRSGANYPDKACRERENSLFTMYLYLNGRCHAICVHYRRIYTDQVCKLIMINYFCFYGPKR